MATQPVSESRSLNEECGIFGVWGHQSAADLTYYGLHALQHRGQEGAGIVANKQGHLCKDNQRLVTCDTQRLVQPELKIFNR